MLNQEDFDILLNWLSPDRDQAGEKYEAIRAGLIRFFQFRGCGNEEDLADETINRVARRLPELDLTTGNKHITYFYGFASKVFLEAIKKQQKLTELESNVDKIGIQKEPDVSDTQFDCLEKCLNELPQAEKQLIKAYYYKEKSEKFEYRQALADKLNISVNALHVKVHRLRKTLKICIIKCINKNNL